MKLKTLALSLVVLFIWASTSWAISLVDGSWTEWSTILSLPADGQVWL